MPRLTKAQQEIIREVIRTARMESASFRDVTSSAPDPTPVIRETTRLWRQTWIIEPLQDLLKDAGARLA